MHITSRIRQNPFIYLRPDYLSKPNESKYFHSSKLKISKFSLILLLSPSSTSSLLLYRSIIFLGMSSHLCRCTCISMYLKIKIFCVIPKKIILTFLNTFQSFRLFKRFIIFLFCYLASTHILHSSPNASLFVHFLSEF